MTVVRLIKAKVLPATQVCFGAPYVIRETDLNRPEVQRAIANGRRVSPNPQQNSFDY